MFVEINNKKQEIKFGYGALRLLAKSYKLKKLSELDKVFSKLNFKENQEPSFDQMDVVAEIIAAGVLNANPKASVTVNDVATEVFLKTPEKLAEILEHFADSMPKGSGK